MNVSARDIEQVEFHDAWRGYNQAEVDDFLDQVGATVERLERENEFLRGRVQELEAAAETARVSEETLKQTLLAAQKTAEETIAGAKAEAERIVGEASSGVDARKQELEGSLNRLQRFETETKQRLRTVLEEQLRALEALAEVPAPAAEPAATPVQDRPLEVEVEVIDAPAGADRVPAPEAGPAQAVEAEIAPEQMKASGEIDTNAFDLQGVEEDDEPALDDFRPFDDEAELQGRRRRGLFRRKVDDWA